MKRQILKILLALAILAFLFWRLNLDFTQVAASVQRPWFLALSLLFPIVINPIIVNNRWRSFLAMIGVEENWLQLAKLTFISTFLGILIPSSQGYDVLRILYIERRHPDNRGQVGSTIIVERLLGLICLFVIAFVAGMVTRRKESLVPILCLFVIIALLCAVLFSDKCYAFCHKRLTNFKFATKISAYIDKLYKGTHDFPFNKSIVGSITLILLLQLANILVVCLLFLSCGVNIGFWNHLWIMPLVSVITMIPITFGGIGLRESGFLLFYSQFGIQQTTIMAVSLLYYVIIMLVPALIGGVLYMADSLRLKRNK